MSGFPTLNFPPFRFRVRKRDNPELHEIWDELRKIWLVLTPEEWVRRHAIRFLTETQSIPEMLISQECPVFIQGMNQRADIVVYGKDGEPFLLVECKAPSVRIDVSVYGQALRYNSIVGAKYIMLTNGKEHYIYGKTTEGYMIVDEFPMQDF